MVGILRSEDWQKFVILDTPWADSLNHTIDQKSQSQVGTRSVIIGDNLRLKASEHLFYLKARLYPPLKKGDF